MSAIEELQTAVASIAERAGPSIVGIGRGTRGSGVVIASGKVLTNAHNLRGDEVTVTFADGRRTRGTVAGWDGDGDLAVIDVDTAAATPLEWADGSSLTVGSAVFGAGASHGGGTRVTFGLVSAVARAFRGPGGRQDRRQRRAHGAARARFVRWRAARRRRDARRPQHQPDRRGLLPGPAGRRRAPGTGRRAGPRRVPDPPAPRRGGRPSHVARRMRRSVGLPERDGILVRGVEDGSLAAAAGIEAGDLIVEAGGKPITDADDLHAALATLELPFEVKLVRGNDERTVQVGGGTTATGEA